MRAKRFTHRLQGVYKSEDFVMAARVAYAIAILHIVGVPFSRTKSFTYLATLVPICRKFMF